MLNRIVVMGRCGKDPEIRMTQKGTSVASVTLAVDRDYSADQNKETDWIDVVAFGKTAEFVEKYFSKGQMAVVTGRLQIRNWEDKEGNKRRSAEILADHVYFGEAKRDKTTQGEPQYDPQGGFSEIEDIDTTLPW
nr:MAG TPA: Single strand binding protein [Caudoviricetes sp.]